MWLGIRDRSKELSFHRALTTEASCWAASFRREGARRGDYTISTVFGRRWNTDISVQRDFRTIWFSFAATATQWWTSGRKMNRCLIHDSSNKQPEPINIYMECSTDCKPAGSHIRTNHVNAKNTAILGCRLCLIASEKHFIFKFGYPKGF